MRYHIYFWKQSNVVYISTLFQKQRVIIQFIVIFFVYTLKTRRQLLLNNKKTLTIDTRCRPFNTFYSHADKILSYNIEVVFWINKKPHLQFIPFFLMDRPVVWSEEIFLFFIIANKYTKHTIIHYSWKILYLQFHSLHMNIQ